MKKRRLFHDRRAFRRRSDSPLVTRVHEECRAGGQRRHRVIDGVWNQPVRYMQKEGMR
jgi:hypothetical protein